MSTSATSSDLVNYFIKVGTKEIDKEFPIFSITVNKTINKIPYAKILLHDGDPAEQSFLISNSNIFEIGKVVEIRLGYQSDLTVVFEGVITKHSLKANNYTNPYLEVYCKDIAYQTTLVPKTISFADTTDSGALESILKNYKSDIKQHISSTTIKHEILAQQDTTDWDFINVRAEANGQVVIVDDGTLTTKKPNSSQTPSYTFTYGVDIYGLDLEMDASTQWQQAGGKIWKHDEQACEVVNASTVGEKSFGATSHAKLAGTNKQEPITFIHGGNVTKEEMKNFSTGLLELNRLAKIRGKVTVQGIADLKPDNTIKIDKGADNFEGNAYVSGVHHRLEGGQWFTDIAVGLPNERYMRKYNNIAGLPAAGMLCPVYGLQIGIVKELYKQENPDPNYRIFVNIPIIHQPNEGIWCRVASFYASKGIGAFIMPEKEDEVIIGFINDDFRSPVVVGSLYSGSKHKTPIQQDQENNIKALVTRSKLAMTFNDKDKAIVFQTPGGRTISISDKSGTIEITNGNANKIILGKQNVEIISNKDIVLNAKGSINLQATDSVQIKGNNKVELSGMNVSANATMKASLVGNSSAQVQSSMSTIIKGTIVQIN
ncbi:MAG: type VI secretion system tip protein VgrG [Candidatus Amoebophilus sp.]